MPLVAPLVALGTLAIVLWVIALAAAIAVIMGYISGVLSGLPFPLNHLAGPVKALAQGITTVCGKLEAGVDHLVGASWHLLARYMDALWHHFERQAHTLWMVANELVPISSALHRVESLIHHAVSGIESVIPRVKSLEREWHGIEHRVKTLERKIAQGIGHDLRIQIKALEQDVTKIENKVVPALRAADAQAEASISDLWKWTKDHTLVAGSAAFAGAVAVALSALGLSWLRCSSNPFNNSKRACGLWGDLAGLLAAAGLFGAAIDFRDIVKAAVALEEHGAEAVAKLTILDSAAIADAAQAVADAANAIAT